MPNKHRHPAGRPHARHGKDSHTGDHIHETHPAIVKRLKRAVGHLNTIITMIEARRSCLDLAQQLHAVENAIASAKKTLIHDHIDHCLDETIETDARGDAVKEFKEITKYL